MDKYIISLYILWLYIKVKIKFQTKAPGGT